MKRHLLAIVLLFAVSGSVSVQAQSKEASDSGEALDVSYFDVNTGQEVPLLRLDKSREYQRKLIYLRLGQRTI